MTTTPKARDSVRVTIANPGGYAAGDRIVLSGLNSSRQAMIVDRVEGADIVLRFPTLRDIGRGALMFVRMKMRRVWWWAIDL